MLIGVAVAAIDADLPVEVLQGARADVEGHAPPDVDTARGPIRSPASGRTAWRTRHRVLFSSLLKLTLAYTPRPRFQTHRGALGAFGPAPGCAGTDRLAFRLTFCCRDAPSGNGFDDVDKRGIRPDAVDRRIQVLANQHAGASTANVSGAHIEALGDGLRDSSAQTIRAAHRETSGQQVSVGRRHIADRAWIGITGVERCSAPAVSRHRPAASVRRCPRAASRRRCPSCRAASSCRS